jgi:transposase
LDNYSIHGSKIAQVALHFAKKVRLHFLPPYCPEHTASKECGKTCTPT